MRRRDFLTLAAGTAAALPFGVRAQRATPRRGPGGRPWLIGALVSFTKVVSDAEILGPFVKGLFELDYVEGRDFRIEARYDDGDTTRDAAFARELVALRPDLLATNGGVTAVALSAATTTIPIIASGILAATLDELVGTNVARPSANVTGIVSDSVALVAKHCELALELVPSAKRLGILVFSLDVDGGAAVRAAASAAAAALKVALVTIDVGQPSDVSAGFRSLADARVDAIVVGRGSAFASDRQRTVAAAAATGIPTIYNQNGYVEAGGLVSYTNGSRVMTSTRLASFADRIFSGSRPGDLPVEQDSSFSMAVNLKTAKALGLTIPPTVLLRADEVVG